MGGFDVILIPRVAVVVVVVVVAAVSVICRGCPFSCPVVFVLPHLSNIVLTTDLVVVVQQEQQEL